MIKRPRIIFIIVVSIAILVSLLLLIFANNQKQESKELPISLKEFTLNDVKAHNTKNSCWTIIDQSVYDITPYINNHPGGDVIINACGTIGTELFNNRLDTNRNSKGSHSPSAKDKLSSYRIGILAP